MASTYFSLRSGEKISFYANAKRTAEGEGIVAWREDIANNLANSDVGDNIDWVPVYLSIDDFVWKIEDEYYHPNVWISIYKWVSDIEDNITPNDGDYYRHRYTVYICEMQSSTGVIYKQTKNINVSIRLNKTSSDSSSGGDSGDSGDSGGSSSGGSSSGGDSGGSTEIDTTLPSITYPEAYIQRTGNAGVSCYIYHPSYAVNCEIVLYLDDGNLVKKSKKVNAGTLEQVSLHESDVDSISTENKEYPYTIFAYCNSNDTVSIYNGTVKRDSKVYSIEAPSTLTLTANTPTKWIDARAIGYNGGDCEITTFTYASSNTSVATVDSAGNVTRVADGYAEITVTSRDTYAQCDAITVSITCVASRDFPEDLPTGNADYLSANLMKDIIDAVVSLSLSKQIDIGGDVTMFNSYSTQIKDVYSVLNNTNTNIKTLCTGTSTTNTLPATFPLQNKNAEWHSIVNQWLGLIHTMHTN